MKKKMGILAGLLMATVVTGYSVGGTYAKYTSSIDLADDARVARWSLTASDSKNCTANYNEDGSIKSWTCKPTDSLKLFAESYDFNGTEYVKAINAGSETEPAKLLAPGTMGEYQVNLGGTIEVRYNLDIEFGMAKDADGNVIYDEPVVNYGFDENGKLVIGAGDNEYRPIKYAIQVATGNTVELSTGKMSLADLQDALATWNASEDSTFAPGRMGRAVIISWSWDTTNKGVVANDGTVLTDAQVDELDTYLAENWAKTHVVAENPGNDLGDSVEYHFVVTATQVTSETDGKGQYSTNANTVR